MGKASLVSWVFKRIRDSRKRLSNDTLSILFQTHGVKFGTTARWDKDPTPEGVSFACPLRRNEKETQIFVLQTYIEASFGGNVKVIVIFLSAIRMRPAFGIRFVPFVIPNGQYFKRNVGRRNELQLRSWNIFFQSKAKMVQFWNQFIGSFHRCTRPLIQRWSTAVQQCMNGIKFGILTHFLLLIKPFINLCGQFRCGTAGSVFIVKL